MKKIIVLLSIVIVIGAVTLEVLRAAYELKQMERHIESHRTHR